MQKKKLIFGFIVLTSVLMMGCIKNTIPQQFQDPTHPKPIMYEKVKI
jgi:hypothetical protein